MSNPDKHNSLSPEELLKLLEEHSGKEASLSDTEMDDFEKEALEGFTAHTTPKQAKDLMEEVNVSISKKTSGVEESSRKNKVIWFSAAASIAVIVIISAVFFKQTKEESVSNIALNEIKQDDVAPAPVAETGKDMQDHTAKNNEPVLGGVKGKEKDVSQELDAKPVVSPPAEKMNDLSFNATTSGETTVAMGEGKAVTSTLAQPTKELAKNSGYVTESDKDGNTDDLAVTDQIAATDKKVETKKVADEMVSREEITVANNKLEEEKNTNASSNDVAFVSKEDTKKKDSEKSTKSRSENTGIAAAGSIAPASASIANDRAYYVGGEMAIKKHVLDHMKSKQLSVILKGTYKITATVMPNGTLKVNTIKNTTSDCNECIAPITDALNSMVKWKTAVKNVESIQSDTEFVLSF